MGTLDQVTQMKNQGVPENEIINKLKEQGVSPKAIGDAMDQSKIKNAVSRQVPDEGMEPSLVGGGAQPAGNSARAQEVRGVPNDEFYMPQSIPRYPTNQPRVQEYQESAEQGYNQESVNQPYQESAEQGYNQESVNQPYQEQYQESYGGGYAPQETYSEEYYPQEGYGEDYGADYSGGGTDTMIEIAEQVFAEKIRKMQKQLEDLNEFKTLAETKLTNATSRLKRIEETMDKLQMAILEKVGSYGQGLESIKKEMSMMQESFSKTLPILAANHSHKIVHKKPAVKKKTGSRKR